MGRPARIAGGPPGIVGIHRSSASGCRAGQVSTGAIVDAHDKSEQLVGFLCMLEEHLAIPFTTELLGMPIRLERVDLDDTEEIVAICRRGQQRQKISLLDLPLPSPPPQGWEWIAAYRHWARGWW